MSKFPLGVTVMTPGACEVVGQLEAVILLRRHASGDWGDLDREDKQANEDALECGARLLSAYHVNGKKVWVITEADRSVTTVLLPEDY